MGNYFEISLMLQWQKRNSQLGTQCLEGMILNSWPVNSQDLGHTLKGIHFYDSWCSEDGLWGFIPCGIICRFVPFGETSCYCLQGGNIYMTRIQSSCKWGRRFLRNVGTDLFPYTALKPRIYFYLKGFLELLTFICPCIVI